jgi:hypothetical protein
MALSVSHSQRLSNGSCSKAVPDRTGKHVTVLMTLILLTTDVFSCPSPSINDEGLCPLNPGRGIRACVRKAGSDLGSEAAALDEGEYSIFILIVLLMILLEHCVSVPRKPLGGYLATCKWDTPSPTTDLSCGIWGTRGRNSSEADYPARHARTSAATLSMSRGSGDCLAAVSSPT